jgi:hypothetical protein
MDEVRPQQIEHEPVALAEVDDAGVTTIVTDTFLAGTLRRIGENWLFWNMTGPSSPLSYDHYYYS